MPTKDVGTVKKFSGGVMLVKEVKDNGGAVAADAWVNLGYIQESNTQDNTDMEEYQDETGNTVASEPTIRLVKVTGLLMQSDKATLDFLKDTVRDKFYALYKYEGITNGKYQEIFYGICKFKPQIDLAAGVKRPPFEITVLENDLAIYYFDSASADVLIWSISGACNYGNTPYIYYTDSNGTRLYQATAGIGNFGTVAPTHLTGSVVSGDITLLFLGQGMFMEPASIYVSEAVPFAITANSYYVVKETAV